MRSYLKLIFVVLAVALTSVTNGQDLNSQSLNSRQQAIISFSALAGAGDLPKLKEALKSGLDAGLTVNQIKEALIHVYAYAGFPRSIRSLQTFMAVMEEREASGIQDLAGPEASPVNDQRTRYARGKAILDSLLGTIQTGPLTGYSAFTPTIEVFLKEHLFADLFERDVLTFQERELVTISVLAAIGGVEPMLQSHFKICLNLGLTPDQLRQFITTIEGAVGNKNAASAQRVLNQVLTK